MLQRRSEEHHHAISGVLVECTLLLEDLPLHTVEIAIQNLHYLRRGQVLRNSGEAPYVGEKDTDLHLAPARLDQIRVP